VTVNVFFPSAPSLCLFFVPSCKANPLHVAASLSPCVFFGDPLFLFLEENPSDGTTPAFFCVRRFNFNTLIPKRDWTFPT